MNLKTSFDLHYCQAQLNQMIFEFWISKQDVCNVENELEEDNDWQLI